MHLFRRGGAERLATLKNFEAVAVRVLRIRIMKLTENRFPFEHFWALVNWEFVAENFAA
jgi:hypothetical protein